MLNRCQSLLFYSFSRISASRETFSFSRTKVNWRLQLVLLLEESDLYQGGRSLLSMRSSCYRVTSFSQNGFPVSLSGLDWKDGSKVESSFPLNMDSTPKAELFYKALRNIKERMPLCQARWELPDVCKASVSYKNNSAYHTT